MKTEDFDKQFDEGKDISHALNIAKAKRPGQEQRRVNVDFPSWMINDLDKEAGRLGVSRQAVIKIWLSEKLEQSHLSRST